MWWLPESPEKQVSGSLTFSPDGGATVDLMGFLAKPVRERARKFEVVLGVSSDGKDITLLDCLEFKGSLTSKLQTSSLYVSRSFVGTHFIKADDVKFKKVSVRYTYLDEWVGISGFDIDILSDVISVKYRQPRPIETNINGDYKLSIGFAYSGPTVTYLVQKEASMKQRTWITIESSQERCLDEYLDIIHRLQDFLTLAISEPVYPLELEGETESSKMELDGHTIYEPVKVCYRQSTVPAKEAGPLQLDMLFNFKDFFDRFSSLISRWFSSFEELQSAMDLYFGSLYNPRTYLEHKFLSIVQALESYHRLKVRRNELPEQEHNNRLKNVMDAVQMQYKEWLEEKLRYSNELTLRTRLKELLNAYPEIVSSAADDKHEFVTKVVDTRNYLIHHDPESKSKAVDGERLSILARRLRALLEACLMTELGFAKDEIRCLFQRNRRYADLLPIRLY